MPEATGGGADSWSQIRRKLPPFSPKALAPQGGQQQWQGQWAACSLQQGLIPEATFWGRGKPEPSRGLQSTAALQLGHRGLGTILGTYTGLFSCPETYKGARANSSRLQERTELRAAPGMSVWPGLLLWPCCVPTQPSENTLSCSTYLQGQFQELSPCAQRDSSGWACPLPPQYQRAMQTS